MHTSPRYDRSMDDVGMDWLERGACVGEPTEDYFPDTSPDPEVLERCRRECPVRWECLRFALATKQIHGVWGGLGERARSRVARRVRNGADPIAEALKEQAVPIRGGRPRERVA